jgi:hypothetical protein
MTSGRGAFFSAAGAAAAALAVLGLSQQLIAKFDLRLPANLLLVGLTGVVGWWAQRLLVLGRRAEAARRADEALAIWPVTTVQEAGEFDLGVYPPMWPGPDAYVTREVDGQLHQALDHGATVADGARSRWWRLFGRAQTAEATFVAVYGPAGSGKSRMAFEGLRRRRGEAWLLVPEDARSLQSLAGAPPRLPSNPAGVVLWLDGLERFLDGLSLDSLVKLAVPGRPFCVVATVGEEKLRELVGGGGAEGHVARRFLARATIVHAPAELSGVELAAAAGAPPFATLDFSGGFASASRSAWKLSAGPVHRVSLPPATPWWPRMRDRAHALPGQVRHVDPLALSLAVVAIALASWIVHIGVTQGLIKPPPVATQLSDLHRELSSCGLSFFSTTSAETINRGDPLIVATDPQRTCPARADANRPILIYDKQHDRLRQVAAFGPPREFGPEGFSFDCRGLDVVDRCWNLLHGGGGGVGAFVSRGTTFPVGISRTKGDFTARPLITEAPALRSQFASPLYRQPLALTPANKVTGYRTTEFALVRAPAGDDVDGPRMVAGYAPHPQSLEPRRLQITARVLTLTNDDLIVLSRRCVPVRPSPRIDELDVRSSEALATLLSGTWMSLENATRTVCY